MKYISRYQSQPVQDKQQNIKHRDNEIFITTDDDEKYDIGNADDAIYLRIGKE